MMTREEINEIEQYCSDHKVGKKARLAELFRLELLADIAPEYALIRMAM